jgi:hypothetical protein
MAAGYVLRAAGQPGAVDTAVDIARLCGFAALAAVGIALCWRALRATLGVDQPRITEHAPTTDGSGAPHGSDAGRRAVVAACGWALVAAAVLLPVFYPWYALVPLAVLACATPPGRTRTALAATTIAITALTLPNGLGIPVLTKLPGAILDVALVVGALAYRFRNRRSNQDDPAPADGRR